jgi:hypothetical protein
VIGNVMIERLPRWLSYPMFARHVRCMLALGNVVSQYFLLLSSIKIWRDIPVWIKKQTGQEVTLHAHLHSLLNYYAVCTFPNLFVI